MPRRSISGAPAGRRARAVRTSANWGIGQSRPRLTSSKCTSVSLAPRHVGHAPNALVGHHREGLQAARPPGSGCAPVSFTISASVSISTARPPVVAELDLVDVLVAANEHRQGTSRSMCTALHSTVLIIRFAVFGKETLAGHDANVGRGLPTHRTRRFAHAGQSMRLDAFSTFAAYSPPSSMRMASSPALPPP